MEMSETEDCSSSDIKLIPITVEEIHFHFCFVMIPLTNEV